jgi:SecD/SecF fusion protein
MMEFFVHIVAMRRLFFPFRRHRLTFDFMAYGRRALIISSLLAAVSVLAIVLKGNKIYGIDFTGGDEIILSYEEPPSIGEVYSLAAASGSGDIIPVLQNNFGNGEKLLRVQTSPGKGEHLVKILKESMPQCQFQLLQKMTIGSSVGSSLRWNTLQSFILAMVGMLFYMTLRFKATYGWGAIASILHDVILTIGIYVFLGRQFNASTIAAILMIIGYSINDTIIIFDRIREELPLHPQKSLREVINLSINGTLSRTLLTSSTTLLAALSLLIFGAGAIKDFALIFSIGIIIGTFSSIFVASPVFHWRHQKFLQH